MTGVCLLLILKVGEEFDKQDNLPRSGVKRIAVAQPMPEPGELLYAQLGEHSGEELMYVQRNPKRKGFWNVRRPDGRVVGLAAQRNASLLSTRNPAIKYQFQPRINDSISAKAKADSEAIIARGSSTTLALYKRPSKKKVSWWIKAAGAASLVPGIVQSSYAWGVTSYMHIGIILCASYSVWWMGSRAANLKPVQRVVGSIGILAGTVRDASVDAFNRMQKARRAFDGMANFVNNNLFDDVRDAAGNPVKATGYQMFLVVLGVLCLLALLIVFRKEIKDKWTEMWPPDPATPPVDPSKSPTVGPIGDPAWDSWEEGEVGRASQNYDHGNDLSPRSASYDQFACLVEKLGNKIDGLERRIDGKEKDQPASASDGQRDSIGMMAKKLDVLEQVVRDDSVQQFAKGGTTPRRGDSGPVVQGVEVGEAAGVLNSLPRGDKLSGEMDFDFLCVTQPAAGQITGIAEQKAEEQAKGDVAYSLLIRPLLEAAVNCYSLMMEELKRFRPIAASSWPFPEGYKARICAAYFAHIFSQYSRAEQFGWAYIREHGLDDCILAHNLPFYLSLIDSFLRHGVKGWINWPAAEQIARSTYSYECAFRNCRFKVDWCRPKEAGQAAKWVSKVDWRAADRIDPRAADTKTFRHDGLDRELRGEMDHKATIINAENRLNTILGPAPDRINLG